MFMLPKKSKAPKSAWYTYKDGVQFEVSLLVPGQQRDINAKTQKIVAGGKDGFVQEFDTASASLMKAQMAITNCRGLKDPDDADGPDVKMTTANKMMLLNNEPDFEGWVLSKYADLEESYRLEQEADEKNSSSSANG
ncbi:hypothetical protein DFW101_3497 [Solidesulfovibrio carbinoliphilus subsp. oakridgensis]|uniref:Uncharacterized protein n=1 Tax=Solidesulfovibrio carbinoliphilus subsp. oakridgensis TaxID=694327 RepID=G7QC47_9BACT|nr:hypothetical protein [Solidesulfovibrio carbinoliphilus]EHJ49493.1 hypothetical protein DFW101_3497 [Solidesulfovibrio carbinoliphilus subsp. oakridgensis]